MYDNSNLLEQRCFSWLNRDIVCEFENKNKLVISSHFDVSVTKVKSFKGKYVNKK